jgi:cellulose synthase/poly-beta-1,6-N-acetylglucosamine synthase-like glycosyltransferase
MITALVPAHNEHDQLGSTLDSLLGQTQPPDQIVVLCDNCSDDTEQIALDHGVEAFVTEGNVFKKAGALNQWLDLHLMDLDRDDRIMVMDADSILDPEFIEQALLRLADGYGACGGVFTGKDGGGFVGMLQRNEFVRYQRDIRRRQGKTLVLTGTATLFTVECLQDVVDAREIGLIPGGAAQVYDTQVLTEDNELTFALLHLDYRIIAPVECHLVTDVMMTWKDLWHQRLRWKRGAIENNVQYGFTPHTLKYWGLQAWGTLGVFVTIVYLLTLTFALATNTMHLQLVWIIVTFIFAAERAVTVHARGWKYAVLGALLIPEMGYDLTLQAVHVKALLDALRRANSSW